MGMPQKSHIIDGVSARYMIIIMSLHITWESNHVASTGSSQLLRLATLLQSVFAAILCSKHPGKGGHIRPQSLGSQGGVVEMGGIYMTQHSGSRCHPWRALTSLKLSQTLYTTTFLVYRGKG